jgi:hypothetical protein
MGGIRYGLRIQPVKIVARGEAMRAWFIVAVLAFSGCAALSPQLNEPEQHLIGRPDTQVLECMGSPREKRADGYTSIQLAPHSRAATHFGKVRAPSIWPGGTG